MLRSSRTAAAEIPMSLRRHTPIAVLLTALIAPILAKSETTEAKDVAFTRAATAAVERIEREDGFSGVILVARGDHILLRKAAGFSNRERNIRNTPEMKFP